jgi:hypothetical protein
MEGTSYCPILLVFLFLYPFFYCGMERKHQGEIVLLKFVKKDNFDIGILITVVECCEC